MSVAACILSRIEWFYSTTIPMEIDMKTVIGLFDYASDAYAAQGDLIGSGLRRERVSVVTSTANRDYRAGANPSGAPSHDHSEAGEGAGLGATAGAIAGGAAGLLASLGLLAIPGIGPILAAGPIIAVLTGAGIGAAAGGLLGGLIGLGIPEHEAEIYAEGVNRGGTLVTVDTDDADADRIAAVLSQHNAVDIDKRASEWETAGWSRKYTSASNAAPSSDASSDIDARARGVDRSSPSDESDAATARRSSAQHLQSPIGLLFARLRHRSCFRFFRFAFRFWFGFSFGIPQFGGHLLQKHLFADFFGDFGIVLEELPGLLAALARDGRCRS